MIERRASLALIAALAGLGLAACQDVNRVETVTEPAEGSGAPRVFTWKLVTETAEMSDGVFVGQDGWVVGPYGTILHTANGGAARADWQVAESGTTGQLDRIAAVATPAGAFAIATGTNLALRYRAGQPSWEAMDAKPASGKRASLHATADGRVEAWLATLDGFAYAADAATGGFVKATVPSGATDVVFAETGESWTLAPVGNDCVPFHRAPGEVAWQPVPVPPHAAPVHPLGFRLTEPRLRSNLALAADFPRARTCADAELLVTLQRKQLWLVVNDGLSEWDGQAWTSYSYPADLSAAVNGPVPAGGITDVVDGGAEVVLFAQRSPPVAYPRRPQANVAATAHKDPHDRALETWAQARQVRFNVTDLWMQGNEVWAAGRDGIAHARDGGQTWSVMPVSELVPPPATQPPGGATASPSTALHAGQPRTGPSPGRAIGGTSLRKLAFNDRATQGWAVSDDGAVFRYDGAWRAAFRIEPMQRALALSVTDDGSVAWLLTRNALYRLTADGATVAARDDRDAMALLAMCPDGRSGWVRHGDDQWYGYTGAAWSSVAARPALACLSEGCAAAQDKADPSTVVCAAGDQIWALDQGQTADGSVWRYPIPNLEPLQSRAAQLWADSAKLPGRMIALRPDGALLRTAGFADQRKIVEPHAEAQGARVALRWKLDGAAGAPPVAWDVQRCVVSDAGNCARDDQWNTEAGLQQSFGDGVYATTVAPPANLVPDTKIVYRIRVTQDRLRRRPVRIAEVTLGESALASAGTTLRPLLEGAALWAALLLAILLLRPRWLLGINDAVRRSLAQLPLFGGIAGDAASVVLARQLIRTPRVTSAWIAHELRAPDPAGKPGRQPAGFASLGDATTRALYQAMPAAQQAWVQLHLARAEQTFLAQKLATERVASGEARAQVTTAAGMRELAKGVSIEDMRALVAPDPRDPKLVLWCCGQGGVGKSHLAFRIARWLLTQALLAQPAIVVVLDENAETQAALEAMIRVKLAALTQATDVDDGLVGQLLAAGAVVLLFDGLTERSPQTITTVRDYLERPQAPALTICTARSPHRFTARRVVTIEPMPLDSDELLPFLSSYRRSLPEAERRSEDLLEPVRLAARRIAEAGRRTRLTPLLVTLLWKEAIAGVAFSGLAVDAFNGYVARALVPASHAPDAAERRRRALVHARELGRLALGKNYRPGRWFTRDAAIHRLRAAGDAAGDSTELAAFVAAGILEESAPDGSELRFLLDPLSEYLCALCILYAHDGSDAEWDAFLATLEQLPADARRDADGFLIALADGWAAHGASLQLTRAPRVDDVLPDT